MGGGLEIDFSHGAVPSLWHAPQTTPAIGWRPVLQVAAVSHVPDVIRGLRPPVRYSLLLSDGVHSIHASFVPSVQHLAGGDQGGGGHGALRRGSVVRLRRFLCLNDPEHVRTVFIIQLEILQTECTPIGSPELYKPARDSEEFGADCKHWFGIVPLDPSGGSSIHNKAINRHSTGAAW